jgi:hypothetical protein
MESVLELSVLESAMESVLALEGSVLESVLESSVLELSAMESVLALVLVLVGPLPTGRCKVR